MKSWIRNLSGFFYNIIKRVALGSFKAKEVKRIYNYHKIPNLFETSGQPGKQQLKLLARRGYEVVINLAAQAGVRYSLENPDAYIKSNLVGFFNIVEACREFNVKRIIFGSTLYVYSEHGSFYKTTKQASELILEN